ncbi:MAG: Crp/Fnr family transcriptional regulator [Elainellaceae cyanobacterium]
MPNSKERVTCHNFILDSLSQQEYDRLLPELEEIELRQGTILYQAREPNTVIYFPTTALLSWTNSTLEGEMVEVGMTGSEGMTGALLLLGENTLPYQVQVQLAGRAFKLPTPTFVDVLRNSIALQQKIAAFVYFNVTQLAQSALCNRFHTVEERLCRWLLTAQDRTQTSDLALTHDILAEMIGARRPAVSLIKGVLQSAGLVQAGRGRITILNREEMEAAACECYHLVKAEFDRYCRTPNG